jgi:hypothetical protein
MVESSDTIIEFGHPFLAMFDNLDRGCSPIIHISRHFMYNCAHLSDLNANMFESLGVLCWQGHGLYGSQAYLGVNNVVFGF